MQPKYKQIRNWVPSREEYHLPPYGAFHSAILSWHLVLLPRHHHISYEQTRNINNNWGTSSSIIQTCFFHLLDNLEKHVEWPNLGSPLTFPVMVPLIVPGAAVYCHNLTRTEPRNCFILFYSPAMLGDIKMHWVDHRAGGRGDMEAAISGFSVKLYGRSPLLVSKGLSSCDTHPSPYKTSVWATVYVHRDF